MEDVVGVEAADHSKLRDATVFEAVAVEEAVAVQEGLELGRQKSDWQK